jgi:chromosome segregation protein
LQGLWSRIHVESGWEAALEAALRERLGALEVSRLEMVRGFAGADGRDAPPAKLAFYSPPVGGATERASGAGLRPLADLLRQHDASQSALLGDWLHGAFAADTLDQALAQREQLQAGQAIYVPAGHAVSRHGVSFFAPDSEQAGLLARAQEIENLDKQLRAQSLIVEQARGDLARAEAAYAEASQQLAAVRRDAVQGQEQVHALQVEALRLEQLAEQTRQRSQQLQGELQDIDEQLDQLQERQVTAEARFEELDMQLADSQERAAQIDDRVIDAERLQPLRTLPGCGGDGAAAAPAEASV